MAGRALKVALIAMGVLVGCAKEPDEGAATDKAAPASAPQAEAPQAVKAPQAPQAPLAKAVEAPALVAMRPMMGREATAMTSVQIDVPTGWSKQTHGAWNVFASKDGKSQIALAAMEPTDVAAPMLKDAARAMGVGEPHVSEEQTIAIGPERLVAHAADGSCAALPNAEAAPNAAPAAVALEPKIAYAVVELTGGKRVFLAHVSPQTSTDVEQRVAMGAVASLHKR